MAREYDLKRLQRSAIDGGGAGIEKASRTLESPEIKWPPTQEKPEDGDLGEKNTLLPEGGDSLEGGEVTGSRGRGGRLAGGG